MKGNLLRVLTAAVLCLFLTGTAFAADKVDIHLEEPGISLQVPADHVNFTRDSMADGPDPAQFGHTRESMLDMMEEQNAWLFSIREDGGAEIFVATEENPMTDLRVLELEMRDQAQELAAGLMEEEGISVQSYSRYETAQALFFVYEFERPRSAGGGYGVQYWTVVGNQAFNIVLNSYTGPVSREQKDLLKETVDSAVFRDGDVVGPFLYEDPISGVSFSVPACWRMAAAEDGTVFFYGIMEFPIFVYQSMDLYLDAMENLSEAEKRLLVRSDFSSYQATPDEMAEILNCPVEEVKQETLGGRTYFSAVMEEGETLYGTVLPMDMTCFICCEGGYLIIFAYSGAMEEVQEDFLQMLGSVEVPQAPDLEVGDMMAAEDAGVGEAYWIRFALNFLVSLLLTAAFCALPIVIYRWGVRKKPMVKKKARWVAYLYVLVTHILVNLLVLAAGGEGNSSVAFILFWGWIDSLILSGGKDPQVQAESTAAADFQRTEAGGTAGETQETAPESGGPREEAPPSDEPQAEEAPPAPQEAAEAPQPPQAEAPFSRKENAPTEAPRVPAVRFCSRCGAEVAEDANFCRRCGAAVHRG